MPFHSAISHPWVAVGLSHLDIVANAVADWLCAIPGAQAVFTYMQNSYQDDPYRVAIEILLIFFAARYLLAKKYRLQSSKIILTEKEIDELVDDWTPEPFVVPPTAEERLELDTIPVITGSSGLKITVDEKELDNVVSYNVLGFLGNSDIKEKAIRALRYYGVGSCGPPGFYGTLDVHMELEKIIAQFLQVPAAILYSQAFSAVTSAIPAFAKRGDVIIADEKCNFAVQRGMLISRSYLYYYKHNDMKDLERVLKEIEEKRKKSKSSLARCFIISEGLFQNNGTIADLPALIDLKKKFKYRLILDETFSIGMIGSRGAGLSDYYKIPATEIDIIIGSFSHSFAAAGGFVAGDVPIVDHQRLSGQGYCYSASMPALLTISAIDAITKLMADPSMMSALKSNITQMRNNLKSKNMIVIGDKDSPIIHLQLAKNNSRANLQRVVETAKQKGVLISRSKYVPHQEQSKPEETIRVVISKGFSVKDIQRIAAVINSAFDSVQ